jgi:hypothetical protein
MNLRHRKYLLFILVICAAVPSRAGTIEIGRSDESALRLSAVGPLEAGTDPVLAEPRVETQYIRTFYMAILFASALFGFVLFFGFNRHIEYIFFSVFCVACARRAYVLPFRTLESIEKTLTLGIGDINVIMYMLAHFSLLAYLITKFSFHKTQKVLSAGIVVFSSVVFFLPLGVAKERIYYEISTVIPFLIVAYALSKRKEGGLFILLGLTGLTVFSRLGNRGIVSNGYYLGIVVFVVCISILSSREIAVQYRQRREAVLRSARLENELLKRNIQPHFILNTLASLQELIEQSPSEASRLVEALAEEFRLFSKVSGEKLISLSEELKMCQAHLKIMEYRKGAHYAFSVAGVEGAEKIPPGILHTIIENGITHGYVDKKQGEFKLTKQRFPKFTRYTVFNDSETGTIRAEVKKGTGLKYVEARLEESFPGRWKLSSGPVAGGWEVVIEIVED